ncbi:MAG: hypothetical protein MJZ34_04260 [Paludibacteraceae bacterium]|nr:hypothetical protein [Paludibacteraceae bacterium]
MVKFFTRFSKGEESTPIIEEKQTQNNEEGPSLETLQFIKEFAHSYFPITKGLDGKSMSISLN